MGQRSLEERRWQREGRRKGVGMKLAQQSEMSRPIVGGWVMVVLAAEAKEKL